MLSREEWLPLARKLDWDYSYVREEEVFPEVISGRPWLPHSEWRDWEESFKTSYREYVDNQYEKDMAVYAVRDAVGRLENIQKLAAPWMNSLKVHAAALALAEFAGVIGNLRGARFGRDSAWRTMATFGALDEYRQFYHTNNWFAVAARHFFDELTVGPNAIEFHIATNFVLETGFTNLQFVGLASLARESERFSSKLLLVEMGQNHLLGFGKAFLATRRSLIGWLLEHGECFLHRGFNRGYGRIRTSPAHTKQQ
jgi:toluene monooxygenase system protein A